MTFWKGVKCVLVTLTCLMMVSSFMGSRLRTVVAYTPPGGWPPGQPYFTLHAVLSTDPYWGELAGYHDIMFAVQEDLSKIGIDLQLHFYDPETVRAICWDERWNYSGAPPGGWDITISEWWMMPTGSIPLESLVYSWATPPDGYNIMSWMNERADEILWKGMHTLDPAARKLFLWVWQELFMRDPPMINLYFPRVYEATGVYVKGWDPIVQFHDVSRLFVNVTSFGLFAPPDRKLIGNDTLIYGVTEPVWTFNPLFALTPAQEKLNLLTHDTLYALSGVGMKPDLAAAAPTWLNGPNGPNTRLRVPLRDNVTWSDCVKFNATDVKFTFDLVLNPDTKAVAYGDFEPAVSSVVIVNATCVDFILREPYADITTLLGIPGATIIPWHILTGVSPSTLRDHPSNWNWTQYLPGTGPFNLTDYYAEGEYIELTRNNLYFGYNASIVNPAGTPYGPYGEPYWGPYNITTVILCCRPDDAVRLLALQMLEIDFGERLVAPLATFQNMQTWPTHKVWQYNRPSSNLLFFNLNNPYLSNRYVRQAIANAINYTKILNVILPTWGVLGIPGKTPILPVPQPFCWKENYTDYAQSGVPDFDQWQQGTYDWTFHCAPVAVANSLWWYDSAYETNTVPPPTMIDGFSLVTGYGPWDDHDPQNVQALVEHLAYLMDTNGNRTGLQHTGTKVADIEAGITQYLSWTRVNPRGDCNGDGVVDNTDQTIVTSALATTPGTPGWDMRADIWPVTTGWAIPGMADNVVNASDLALVTANIGKTGIFYEHTVPMPNFFFIEEEVERCQDVVLALGFYYEFEPGQYLREGLEHAVTVAGIDSNNTQIAISDPGRDAFEKGWAPGRSPVPHEHLPPEQYTTHNNASLVSHDIYNVNFNPVMGMWELIGYGSSELTHVLLEYAVITSPNPREEPDIFQYNITAAEQYMNMWKFAQAKYAPEGSAEVALGPVGDADFSGFVDLIDFYIWAENFGTTPADWTWLPGQDIDPDFDNNEYVELRDFYIWVKAWGNYYPFEGAR